MILAALRLDRDTASHLALALHYYRKEAARRGVQAPQGLADLEAMAVEATSEPLADSAVVPQGPAVASSSVSMSETISTREAAEQLGVSTRHARTLAASGKVPALREGRDWRLDAAAVAEKARREQTGLAGRGAPGPHGSARPAESSTTEDT